MILASDTWPEAVEGVALVCSIAWALSAFFIAAAIAKKRGEDR